MVGWRAKSLAWALTAGTVLGTASTALAAEGAQGPSRKEFFILLGVALFAQFLAWVLYKVLYGRVVERWSVEYALNFSVYFLVAATATIWLGFYMTLYEPAWALIGWIIVAVLWAAWLIMGIVGFVRRT